ncbi:HAD family hydrolase [Methanoregula sp.]|uniref:HAD family hydrolase n=1 Tax=Methanoregula sp. TaxID=2052170 RepID=UPI002635A45B|nr:HAD family hydrolase [Methanoregula sp.]MDD5141941.1 HAD family hydrolase [Methanoregula sp.]
MSTSGAVSTLLFDMDNTLFDLVEAQGTSCHAVARFLGHDDGDKLFSYFLHPVHGFESHANIRQYMEDRRIPLDGAFPAACRVYESVKLNAIRPYPGVVETLQHLSDEGYPMCIVTDAHSRDATLRLEKTGMLRYFTSLVSFDLVQEKKPGSGPFLTALEMMQVSPLDVLLIGDSIRRDIEPCTRLGIRTVYARYGDRFSADRQGRGADYAIDSMSELPGIIRRINRA